MGHEITYYLISAKDIKTNKQEPYFIGKKYHHLYFNESIDWWDIKEYGYANENMANAIGNPLEPLSEEEYAYEQSYFNRRIKEDYIY